MDSLKKKLGSDQTVIGTFCQIGHPEIVEIVGAAGFDFAVLDMEHGHFGIDVAANLVRAAESCALSTVIRVPDNSPALILRALDLGGGGVLVPQISDRHQAEAAVSAAKYHPEGSRGACPFIRATHHYTADWPAYSVDANRNTVVMLLLEGVISESELEAIIATPHLDAVMVGPFDLSVSLGVGGQLDHPAIQERIEQLARLCAEYGVALCVPAFDQDIQKTKSRMKTWMSGGCSNFCVGTDRMLLSQHLKTIIHSIVE